MSEYSLANTKNVYFLNGSTKELDDVFSIYGITVTSGGEDGMSIHTNVIYIIDEAGQIRYIVGDDPAPGSAGRASTARVLERAIDSLKK
jgi:cytochrome oxidase Cu insertion factor (SCO1/SenC/PrrC family)